MNDARTQILSQPPDPARPYMYRGTRVFVNKFAIVSGEALEKVVRTTTRLRVELLRQNPIPGVFDFDHLCAIHRYIFQDAYEWAGEIRVCDIEFSEGPPYTRATDIASLGKRIFGDLKSENLLRGLSLLTFIDRATFYFVLLMELHPFRDGNGRSVRCMFEQLAAERGWRLNLDVIPKAEMGAACQAGRCGDLAPLVYVFTQAIQLGGSVGQEA